MQCQFIAARSTAAGRMTLFRIGEYQYEICASQAAGFRRVRLLVNAGVTQALAALAALR